MSLLNVYDQGKAIILGLLSLSSLFGKMLIVSIFVIVNNNSMRRIITILSLLFCSFLAFGQIDSNGTIKFLGIPVDGNKEEMISKLKEKGFYYNSYFDELKGEFNGRDVNLYIRTNHGLVDRVCVVFPSVDKRQVIQEYNTLLSQFQANEKYIELFTNSKIPITENIAYEMNIRNKTYSSRFSYISPDLFTKEEAEKMRQTLASYQKMSLDEIQQSTQSLVDSIGNNVHQADLDQTLSMLQKYQSVFIGYVWFTIHEDGSQYQIVLYYDNLNNHPHGEDL